MQIKKERYQIILKGHIRFDWSVCFDEVSIEHIENEQTIITGTLPDQTALHGVLMRIRDFGISLLEVKRL